MKIDLELIQQDIDKGLDKEKAAQRRKRIMKTRKNRHKGINTFKELKGLFDEQTQSSK